MVAPGAGLGLRAAGETTGALFQNEDVSAAIPSRVHRLVLLTLGYYLAGRLALLMAIPPGYATPVWPAAGIALVGLLALGWRAFPTVVLGSFLVNLHAGFDGGNTEAAVRSTLVALTIAVGAGIQAAVGAEGIRRAVGYPHPFDEQREIVRFLLIGGPASCMVSATCGTGALWAAGAVSASQLAYTWFTWWVGDSIGVLVFAPLLLVAFGEPRPSWRRRLWALGVVPLGGFLMVTTLFLWVSEREHQRLQTEFAQRCDPIARAIQVAAEESINLGGAVASLLRVVPQLDEPAFVAFANGLRRQQPALWALSRIDRVARADRPAWEAARGLEITRLTKDGARVTAEARDEHFVVASIAPVESNFTALGFDLSSEPVRRTALMEALSSGEPTATSPLRLIQDPRLGIGVLVFQRVDAIGGPQASVTSTVLALDRLVASATHGLNTEGVRLKLTDGGEALYVEEGATGSGASWVSTISVAGREWRAEFRPTPEYSDAQRTWEASAVLLLGLAMVALGELTLLISTGRELRLSAAEDRANALLRAMPDAILRLDPAGHALDFRPPASDTAAESWGASSELALAGVKHRLQASLPAVRASGAAGRWDYQVATDAGTVDLEARVVTGVREDFLVVIRDVSAQRAIERRMRSTLAEKDVLLREIHHRVKNNLQVVSSLLNLADDRVQDPEARALLSHTQGRVRTIALVHDQLHRSADLAHVGFGAYLRVLATHLPQVVGAGGDRIRIEVSGDDLTLPLDVAVPCGLIVNELVTNAFQHAFPDERAGTVRISLRRMDELRVELVVGNDGVAPDPGWNARAAGGTGLELVFLLAEQIEAEVSVVITEGLSFKLVFSASEP